MWRAFILALCALALGLTALTGYASLTRGDMGWHTTTITPYRDRVVAVDPGSAAAEAGVRRGDVVDLTTLSPSDRWRIGSGAWVGHPAPGYAVDVTIIRDGRPFVAHLVARPVHLTANAPTVAYFFAGLGGSVWLALFAALVGLRAADDRRARLAAGAFAALVIAAATEPWNLFYAWPFALDIASSLLGQQLAGCISFILLILFAVSFVQTRREETIRVAWFVIAVAIVDSILDGLGNLAPFTPALDASSGHLAVATVASDTITSILALGFFLLTIVRAQGDERSRLVWAIGPVMLYTLTTTSLFAFLPLSARGFFSTVDNIGWLLMPVALTYAVLGRRVLDIGFALNRAAVFAATSVLIAGVFAALQWTASTLLASVVHVRSLTSQAVIVLIVYYIVRLSRRSTDAVVTRVFFASRDRRLRALRATLRELDEVADAEAIAPFLVGTLGAAAHVRAGVLLPEADGSFAPASGFPHGTAALQRNDPRLIRLRAEREPIISTSARELGELGDVAFPMLVRGRLRGVLFCSDDRGAELAPDEIHVLALIASRAATNRDDLLAETMRIENERLLRENLDVRLENERLRLSRAF